MKKLFDGVIEFWNGLEESVVNLLCIVAPWLTTVVPASMTYLHTTTVLRFPTWLGLVAAAVIETVGFSAVRTTVSFMEHNKRYSKDENRAPVLIPILTYIFYLLVILSVNVLLEVSSGVVALHIWVIGLLSVLSFPGALLVGVRTQHSELLRELSERRTNARLSRQANGQRPDTHRTDTGRTPNRTANRRTPDTFGLVSVQNRILSEAERIQREENRKPGVRELSRLTGASKSYVSDVLKPDTKDEQG